MRDVLGTCQQNPNTPFTEVLQLPLPFRIPIMGVSTVEQYPDVFELGETEYGYSVDQWISDFALTSSATSEISVVSMDFLWQGILDKICGLTLLLNQCDPSSLIRLRPDFTALFNKMLVIKGEAKAEAENIPTAIQELIGKFHDTAHLMFPEHSPIIPGVASSKQMISLHRIYFDSRTRQYRQDFVKSYRVLDLNGRISFIIDVFKIARWIVSQIKPSQFFHLVTDVRLKTRNGHHVTLVREGIVKEFYHRNERPIPMDIIRQIYAAKLPNVEQGVANCMTITISTVGHKLGYAIHMLGLDKAEVWRQIQQAVEQLHGLGFAHCDICADNVFVNLVNNVVFLGDLEYCQRKEDPAPQGLRRSDPQARTGEDLDFIQLDQLRDELARL